jgi:uncharacterized protein YndB with AHSA1/START domain
MPETAKLHLTAHGDREILMTRAFDAPRAFVFEALTQPDMLKRWLHGPPGWEMVECAVDLTVGGAFRFAWRNGADGSGIGIRGAYHEIAAPARLVHTERFDEAWYPGMATITTNLAEDCGATTLTATLQYESREARDAVVNSGMEQGVAACYDTLADVLRAMQVHGGASEGDVTITRRFDAPRARVWQAWTDPQQLAAWWGPNGFTNPVCEVDVRSGGALRIVMRGPDGTEYPMRGEFRDVAAPERLAFTNVAVDARDMPLIDGMTTVTFATIGDSTEMTMHTRAMARTPQAVRMLAGMEMGWTQSFGRLGDYLARAAV